LALLYLRRDEVSVNESGGSGLAGDLCARRSGVSQLCGFFLLWCNNKAGKSSMYMMSVDVLWLKKKKKKKKKTVVLSVRPSWIPAS
jgi:hypothetical protein